MKIIDMVSNLSCPKCHSFVEDVIQEKLIKEYKDYEKNYTKN